LKHKLFFALAALSTVLTAVLALAPAGTRAASHREAPLIALDPTADITDFFFFRSYETGKADRVALIMNVIPAEEPSAGPYYYNFDPNVRYSFSIDNDADGEAEDVVFEVTFKNEVRGAIDALDLPLGYAALPAITALDGAGSEGFGLRQKYTVTAYFDGKRETLGSGLIAVPSNVGPRTMPNYPDLASQGIYTIDEDVRVFAGQRQDPFYIDLGGAFDTLNLRRELPLLSADEDADDNANSFGANTIARFSVNTIALEVPISLLTDDEEDAGVTEQPVLGAYASTARKSRTVLSTEKGVSTSGKWVQVQRMANPLVNELIIGTGDKDRWNRLDPEEEKKFLDYYRNPRFALALQTVYGVPAGTSNREDLVNLLLTYGGDDDDYSELLRLNVGVEPVALDAQKRLTVLAGDNAGWPNGRRPKDDVTDIAIRVVGGENYINGRAGDGVNTDDAELKAAFPFLATPFDGRDITSEDAK
jgi:hypothetical protein